LLLDPEEERSFDCSKKGPEEDTRFDWSLKDYSGGDVWSFETGKVTWRIVSFYLSPKFGAWVLTVHIKC